LSADVTVAPAVPTITLQVFTISSSLEASSGLGHGVGRDEDVVDDVHNTVGSIDISGGYFGVVDVDVVVVEESLDFLAFNSLDLLVVLEVLGVHGAGSNVVGEHIVELLDVLGVEEVVEERLGELGEGLVGGGEHGEGTGTGKGVDELAGLEGSDEGGEIGSGNGEVNDGLAGRGGRGGAAGVPVINRHTELC